MKQSLGEFLYDARIKRKLSVRDLSSAADVAINTIYGWEKDSKSPTLSTLQKVCKVLRVSIQINENGEMEGIM